MGRVGAARGEDGAADRAIGQERELGVPLVLGCTPDALEAREGVDHEGVARREPRRRATVMENGSPRLAARAELVRPGELRPAGGDDPHRDDRDDDTGDGERLCCDAGDASRAQRKSLRRKISEARTRRTVV